MFDLGFQELIVIFIVALLVFGPQKLPELARTLGKAVRDIKQSMSGVKEQIDSEIREIKDPANLNAIYRENDSPNEIKKTEAEVHNKSGENDDVKRDSSDKTSKTMGQKTG